VREAVRLINDGCLSKAMAYLGENGLGDMSLPEIKEQLRRKHPQERRAEWDAALINDTERMELGDASGARDALKNLKRNAGTGPNRFRNEYLLRLVRGEVTTELRAQVLGAWATFADHVVNNDLPDWFYLVWTSVVQFAPIKNAGETPAQAEVRPVACGGAERRAVMQLVKKVKREKLRQYCEPVQLGQGTSGGVQTFGLGLRMHMQLYPHHVLAALDFLNGFNTIDRAKVMAICLEDPELHDLPRLLHSELRPRSRIYTMRDGKLELLDWRSVTGTQQGALTGSLGFNVGTLRMFKAVDAEVSADGNNGCARAIMDDLAVAGPPDVVWRAIARLDLAMLQFGLERHPTKSQCYSPSGNYGERPPWMTVGRNGGEGTSRPAGLGIVVAGVPIGDDLFVGNVVAAGVADTCGIINQIQTSLRIHPAAVDHGFHVDRLSLAHRLDFIASVVSPNVPGVEEFLQQADNHRLAALEIATRINFLAEPEQVDPTFTRDRAFLAARHHGMGITRNADVAKAAFVGCVNLVLPRFPDSVGPDGARVPGLFDHLSVATGNDFSNPVGRWTTLIESGLQIGIDFELAWNTLREECGSRPGSVFAATAADAPGRPDQDDVRPSEGDQRVRLQR
jgi:hypothetical protein